MSIDLSQFHGVFFEESFEGLEIMESELLELDYKNPGEEEINNIFRAAHSIKGGSGSFGFNEITGFTHVLETLLDEVRAGKHELNQDEVNLLLTSVDCLRDMLSAARDKTDVDEEHIQSVQSDLEKVLDNESSCKEGNDDSTNSEKENVSGEENVSGTGWQINFVPHHHLFQTGNDPLRMFRELEDLGELSTEVSIDKLPPFDKYDTEECYLSWNLVLTTDVGEDQVKEIFEWVEDDCDLEITKIIDSESKNEKPADNQVKEAKPAEERRTPTSDRRKTERRGKAGSESSSIRVNTDKIDALINMVGELVITQSMLGQFGEDFDIKNIDKLNDGLKQLERNTRELQENVMQIRMLPISFSFNRFPRLVHDLSSKLNKKIELKLSGESTELDKTVMEKIGDPLVHLVRNSIDHGIEMPEDRFAAGKPETGTIHLNAYHEGGNIVIDIEDDGAGLNKERILQKAIERGIVKEGETLSDSKINELIFKAGFSTAETVSDVSGRGVGMDVVKRNIHDLGGVVEVKSVEGKGSIFSIRLPLTLAILDGQLIRVGNQTYIIPLISIIESLQVKAVDTKSIAGDAEVYRLREDYIPILRLHSVFNIDCDSTKLDNGLLVVVEAEGQKIGLFIDDLLAQQQVVIKSLETNYQKIEGISGATILGDGTVAMILDVSSLLGLYRQHAEYNESSVINNQAA
jgi:two-component system, chemotaxis family, sensor kinase CheA